MERHLKIALASLALLLAPLAARAAYVPGNDEVSPIAYGCWGDGVHDDSTCFANALSASRGKILRLGNYKYRLVTAPPTINYPVHVEGTLPGYDSTFPNDVSEIVAGSTNMSIFNLAGGASGSILENFAIKMGAAGTNTSGVAVTIGSVSQVLVSNLWIDHPCVGIDLNGNTNTVQGSYLSKVGGVGCGGIRVGFASTNAGTVDPLLMNTTVQGDTLNVADYALDIKDAGGMAIYNFDGLYTSQGTTINPAANQAVMWLFATGSALGDSNPNQALLINTGAASSVVKGLQFTEDWSATSTTSDGVQIANTGGGTVTDIYFNGHRSYNNFGNGFTVFSGATNVSIDASHICGFGGDGVELKSTVSQVRIRNNDISPSCAGVSFSGTHAIFLDGSNATITIAGNDTVGSATSVTGVPTGVSTATGNGIDNTSVTVASASTINLTTVAPTYLITGTTGISNITGGWNGRVVRLITTGGAVTFSSGGSTGSAIVNTVTSSQNVPITAYYDSSQWYLK